MGNDVAKESEIGEDRPALDDVGDAVAQLSAQIFVASGRQRHLRSVGDVIAQRRHSEADRKRLVGAPVIRKCRADDVRTSGEHVGDVCGSEIGRRRSSPVPVPVRRRQ